MRCLTFILAVLLIACETAVPEVDKEAVKKEITAMETEFARFLKDSGVAKAFYKYAAPDAVIKRQNDTLIVGKKAIGDYYASPEYAAAVAEWTPDFVDVSEDGTMAYTYGKYTWRFPGEDGKEASFSGIFHTVWKKMPDGSWKYVWD